MPLIPTTSAFVAATTAAGETIVVRGYLGPPGDVLRQANDILTKNGVGGKATTAAEITAVETNPAAGSPWRIYLTVLRDCWIEVPDWNACVAYVVAETDPDRADAYTVWLRRKVNGVLVEYRVVKVRTLGQDEDFVSGKLVEDYMTLGASNNAVWDEQQYGPTTGKISGPKCF